MNSTTKKSICFDLDDTICFPNHCATDSYKKYGLALPNHDVIKTMWDLKDHGYHIVILSARRMVTHQGDMVKILDDIGEITIDWLKKHDVPYDELIFGKPYVTTYYVDDKGMNLNDYMVWVKQFDNRPYEYEFSNEDSDWEIW